MVNKVTGPFQGHQATSFSGIAMHILTDGCQFLLHGQVPSVGARLVVFAEHDEAVTGVVQWVVANRIGFAFEPSIGRRSRLRLEQRCRQRIAVALYKT